MLAGLAVRPTDRILELGCGSGGHSVARVATANSVVGVDILPPQRVRLRASNFRYVCADAGDLSRFADGEFDVAVSFGMLEHVRPRAHLVAVIGETRRVAGRYCFVVPHRFAFVEPHFLLPLFAIWPARLKSALIRRVPLGSQPRSPTGEWQPINWFTKAQWRELFGDPTLRIVNHWYGPILLDYLIYGGRLPAAG